MPGGAGGLGREATALEWGGPAQVGAKGGRWVVMGRAITLQDNGSASCKHNVVTDDRPRVSHPARARRSVHRLGGGDLLLD